MHKFELLFNLIFDLYILAHEESVRHMFYFVMGYGNKPQTLNICNNRKLQHPFFYVFIIGGFSYFAYLFEGKYIILYNVCLILYGSCVQ